MKPCPNRKKEITWLALGELNADAAQLLRSHIETCPGCRSFWHEISDLQHDLRVVATPLSLELPPGFHRDTANRIRNEQKPSRTATIRWLETVCRFKEYGWRWQAGAAALVAIIIGLLTSRSLFEKSPEPSSWVSTDNAPLSAALPAPTSLARYRNAAAESLDSLDSLLARQAIASSPMESFRISNVHRSSLIANQ